MSIKNATKSRGLSTASCVLIDAKTKYASTNAPKPSEKKYRCSVFMEKKHLPFTIEIKIMSGLFPVDLTKLIPGDSANIVID